MGKSRKPGPHRANRLKIGALIALAGCATAAAGFALTHPASPAGAAALSPIPYTSPPASGLIQVGVLGDSYTSGTRIGGLATQNWTRIAQADLYKAGLDIDLSALASEGTGYVAHGLSGYNFQTSASTVAGPRTKLVIVAGGRNDWRVASPAEVRAAAVKTYAELRRLAPSAKLIVVGPAWPTGGVPAKVADLRDVIRDAAAAAGATFVDPLEEGWFSGENRFLIGEDGENPKDDGHVRMAKLLEPRIKAALGK